MIDFTYEKYLYYLKITKQENTVMEVSEKYILNNVNNPHDKIFRDILGNKKEVAKFINKTIKPKYEIDTKDIEKYNSSFITKGYKNRESDIVYKLKNKDVFFLIEHQTKIDYSMPKRIIEYEFEIIGESLIGKQVNKETKFARIIPIVLYTGKPKWNASTNMENNKENFETKKDLELGEYYIVDINNYTKKELMEDESFLSKLMLLEKTKTNEELYKTLEVLIKANLQKTQKELLKRMITYIFNEKLGKERTKELLEELDKNGGGDNMILERIKQENIDIRNKGIADGIKTGRKSGIAYGIRKNKLETAKKMKKEGTNIEFIKKITGLTEEEINSIG